MYRPCEICGGHSCHTHHVFPGSLRRFSEKYGLTMRLCPRCHDLIHSDICLAEKYKMKYQNKFIAEYGWELWWKEAGRSWL